MSDPALTKYEAEIFAHVNEYGCHVTTVFDPDEVAPNFSYSVGFWESVGQPEVIILGLPSNMGHIAINETLRQCKEEGLRLSDWQPIEGLFEEFDVTCVARTVDPAHMVIEYFNSALWYHELRTGKPLDEALQLVWSYDGLHPWDEGAPAALFEDQPLLYSGTRH